MPFQKGNKHGKGRTGPNKLTASAKEAFSLAFDKLGGYERMDDLVYSCQPCNNSKRNKTLMEFVIHRMQPNLLDKSILIQCAAKRAADRLVPRHASAVN